MKAQGLATVHGALPQNSHHVPSVRRCGLGHGEPSEAASRVSAPTSLLSSAGSALVWSPRYWQELAGAGSGCGVWGDVHQCTDVNCCVQGEGDQLSRLLAPAPRFSRCFSPHGQAGYQKTLGQKALPVDFTFESSLNRIYGSICKRLVKNGKGLSWTGPGLARA